MKYLILISIFSLSNFTKAESSIEDQVNADRSCVCNGLPGNLPVVGLFHKSNWGTSALKVFSIDDPQAQNKCQQLLKQLKEIDVCN